MQNYLRKYGCSAELIGIDQSERIDRALYPQPWDIAYGVVFGVPHHPEYFYYLDGTPYGYGCGAANGYGFKDGSCDVIRHGHRPEDRL